MKYKSGVYKIINKITRKYYIGHSIEIEKRFWRHRYELSRNIHHSSYLQRSWNKYGEENFTFQTFKECNKEEAAAIEKHFLDKKGELYNTSDQVSGGDLISNHPNRFNIVKKITATNKKRYAAMTEQERKEKYGRKGIENGMYGRTHTK